MTSHKQGKSSHACLCLGAGCRKLHNRDRGLQARQNAKAYPALSFVSPQMRPCSKSIPQEEALGTEIFAIAVDRFRRSSTELHKLRPMLPGAFPDESPHNGSEEVSDGDQVTGHPRQQTSCLSAHVQPGHDSGHKRYESFDSEA